MLFLCVSLLLSFIGIENIIERAFDLLGIKLYVRYFTSSFSNTEFALAQKMTKYIYVPFYLLSLNLYNGLNKDEKFFFNAGFLSFCFKIISLSSFIVGRFVYFFEVLTIIPLYYLLCWLMARKNKDKSINMFFIAMLLCAGIGLLTLKVIVANDGEYHYQSIFSLYFQS
jgi:hypothetical protein